MINQNLRKVLKHGVSGSTKGVPTQAFLSGISLREAYTQNVGAALNWKHHFFSLGNQKVTETKVVSTYTGWRVGDYIQIQTIYFQLNGIIGQPFAREQGRRMRKELKEIFTIEKGFKSNNIVAKDQLNTLQCPKFCHIINGTTTGPCNHTLQDQVNLTGKALFPAT